MPNWATAYDFETVTVSNTGIGFTATKYRPADTSRKATTVLLTVEGDSLRFRLDGTNPTASVGHLVTAGGSVTLEGYDNIKNFRAIRVTTDATVRVSFMR